MKRRRKVAPQLGLRLEPRTHGGRREGAGRPLSKFRKWVPRGIREDFDPRHPNHVTLRLLDGGPRLRKKTIYRMVREVMRHVLCDDFRICHYSLQGNHLHLVIEARDKIVRGQQLKVFASMVAKRLNRLRGTHGRVFGDRYHVRVLRTPTEVRNCLCYVLNNWRHHRADQPWATDPFSSGALFDGWTDADVEEHPLWLDDDEPIPIATPSSWLLSAGWQRAGGRISTREVPGRR
jgi:hypothetical protein